MALRSESFGTSPETRKEPSSMERLLKEFETIEPNPETKRLQREERERQERERMM